MVHKRNRNRNIAIVIILIVALILVQSQTNIFPLSISGTSTLSLQQAQLQSSNPFLDGKVWLLTFRAGGLGQSYFGSFSPSAVQSATSDSSTTTKTFTIEVEYKDQQCSYPITSTSSNKPLYEMQRGTWSCLTFPSQQRAQEKTGISNVLWFGKYPSSVTCFGIGYNQKSPVGNINSPDIESEFEITVNAGGNIDRRTINTLSGSTQGSIGDASYAVWQGNLVSGKSCPDKDPFVPIYVNGIWRMGDSNSYSDYRSLISIGPPSDRSSQDIWFNGVINSVAQTKLRKSFGLIQSSTSLSSAIIKVIITDPVQFPVTTLYIKASEIGIFTPTCDIRLSNSDSQCFETGEQGSLSVNLRNAGNELCSVNLFAQCQSPFTSTRNIQVSLQPGESTTKLIPLSAFATKEIRSSCTIFAESTGGTKSISVNTCVKPQITCNANQRFCSTSGASEVIKQCSANGATSSIVETCSSGFSCQDTECVKDTTGGGGGFFSRFFGAIGDFFKGIFSGVFDFIRIVKLATTLIVFVFGFLFSRDFFNLFRQIKSKKGISSFLGIVVGATLAFTTFKFFVVGLVALGIVILARFFLPRFK